MKLESMSVRAVTLVTFLAVVASARLLPAADAPKKATDPLAGAFFPPEMVLLAHNQIGLNAGQRQAIKDCMENTHRRGDELRTKLEHETATLAGLAKQQHVDEGAIIAQFDKLLDVEREAKHLHIGLLVTVKNLLTPEQQAQLRRIAKDGGAQLAEQMRKRLTEKVDRVQRIARDWGDSGRDPSPIAKAMEEKIKPLIDSGKAMQAEAELDRLLEQLQQKAK